MNVPEYYVYTYSTTKYVKFTEERILSAFFS